MRSPLFITVDAETDVIHQGVRCIAEIRDQLERQLSVRIPINWFVRFQRGWSDSVENDQRQYFEAPFEAGYDGFGLLGDTLAQSLPRRLNTGRI